MKHMQKTTSREAKRTPYERKDFDRRTTAAPSWACGCSKCEFGLVKPVPDANAMPGPLYLVRMYQARNDRLTFCDCKAGRAYSNHLLGVFDAVEAGVDHVPPATREAIVDAVTMPTVNGERVTA